MQYTIRTDEKFYNQFQSLQDRIKELSCLFQNPNTEASDIEIIEWRTITTKLQKDLAKLIIEADFRINMKL